MAIFKRSENPFGKEVQYKKYREIVEEDFRHCCCYCLLGELMAGGKENFELEHFKPKSKFPESVNDFLNILYACHPCNHTKRAKWPTESLLNKGFRFVDFSEEDFSTHFKEENGQWIPLTDAGKYTEERVRLNRAHLIDVRKLVKGIAQLTGSPYIDWDKADNEYFLQFLTN